MLVRRLFATAAGSGRPSSERYILRSLQTYRKQHIRAIFVTAHGKRPGTLGSRCIQRPDALGNRARYSTLLSHVPSLLVPPLVFTGLLLSLWAYKCLMTVLFQDKIIYMPYMPPFTKSEKLEDYVAVCKPVEWREQYIASLDGTQVAICTGQVPSSEQTEVKDVARRHVVICYFHGNGGSVPPRLPLLSNTLRLLQSSASPGTRYTLIVLSYRGYWISRGRPSEKGIKLDAQALLQHVSRSYPQGDVVLWGQSLGAGVACAAAAEHCSLQSADKAAKSSIRALVLETPFTSIKAMLFALYPQKWLPYQYLHPFLWNHWNSPSALRRLSQTSFRKSGKVLLLTATRDEIVPAEEAGKIAHVCQESGLSVDRTDVIGSLHNEATVRKEGQEAVAGFVKRCVAS